MGSGGREEGILPGEWGMAPATPVGSDTGPFWAPVLLAACLAEGGSQACMGEQVARPMALSEGL